MELSFWGAFSNILPGCSNIAKNVLIKVGFSNISARCSNKYPKCSNKVSECSYITVQSSNIGCNSSNKTPNRIPQTEKQGKLPQPKAHLLKTSNKTTQPHKKTETL